MKKTLLTACFLAASFFANSAVASPFQKLPIPVLIEQLNLEFPGMPFDCVDLVANKRMIPHSIMYGFLSIERGADRKGRPLRTPIKTADGRVLGFALGWFQINEIFLSDPALVSSDIRADDLLNAPCTNADVAGWIISNCKKKYEGEWEARLDDVVKCYHRPRKTTGTDLLVREKYLQQFRRTYMEMEKRIEKRSRSM